jgi:hypothetical protein
MPAAQFEQNRRDLPGWYYSREKSGSDVEKWQVSAEFDGSVSDRLTAHHWCFSPIFSKKLKFFVTWNNFVLTDCENMSYHLSR